MGLCVLIVGNPVDGIRVFGPFKTGEDAYAFADNECDGDWWLAKLEAPEEYK